MYWSKLLQYIGHEVWGLCHTYRPHIVGIKDVVSGDDDEFGNHVMTAIITRYMLSSCVCHKLALYQNGYT